MYFVRVAINIPSLTGILDYHLPPHLEERVNVGHLVTVPLVNQTIQAVVVELATTSPIADTKPVLALLDDSPVVTSEQLALARWMAEATFSSLAACLNLMVPVGLSQQADIIYRLAQPGSNSPLPQPSVIRRRLIELLQSRGPLRGRQLDRHFKNVEWRNAARSLVKSGVLASQPILPPPSVRPKYVRTAQLAVHPEVAQSALTSLGRTEASLMRRQAALRLLMDEPGEMNVSWVYASSGCTLSDLQELAERELISLHETEIFRDPLQSLQPEGHAREAIPTLTADQQNAWQQILPAFGQSDAHPLTFLLQGVTGSGKTEIYLRAAWECLSRGRQALILVPEIALTPQTVRRFLQRFPGEVGLLHSRLSPGERYDTWRRARSGALKIIIGPRSALFAPLPRVGFIAVDECHDSSFYQSEPPFYSAVDASMAYARICNAVCILGSATPSIVQRHQASIPPMPVVPVRLQLLELPRRVVNPEPPPVSVVDMRQELINGNRSIFSRELQQSLKDVLDSGQQAILFLNRRGTSTYVFCRNCGLALRCPRCETPLTFHLENAAPSTSHLAGELRCHHCGYERQMPANCPSCSSDQIRQYGLGSEKVEADLAVLFPSARLLRWDWETTREKDAHEIILAHFAAHHADVLIGTQMLAKGLDLPLVTLVGIVLADVGLSLPDPFTAERTFDVLTQVAGRAGRSPLGGRVVLQTFQPEHYVIQAASAHDYPGFYALELQNRRSLGYPPFQRLVRLEYRHTQSTPAETEAVKLANALADWIREDHRLETSLIGPAPCFHAKLNGLYRWQIILRGPDPAALLKEHFSSSNQGMLKGWRVEVDPQSLL